MKQRQHQQQRQQYDHNSDKKKFMSCLEPGSGRIVPVDQSGEITYDVKMRVAENESWISDYSIFIRFLVAHTRNQEKKRNPFSLRGCAKYFLAFPDQNVSTLFAYIAIEHSP